MATIWVVDGAYLFKCSHGREFDYLKLRAELEKASGGAFYEAYYLNSTPDPPSDGQNGFHSWLKRARPEGPHMRVQLYKLKDLAVKCDCGNEFARQVQKGVDVGIATVVLKLAFKGKYDRLVLSAGDGDFEDTIDYAKSELGKEIWLAGYRGSVSADLMSYADQVIWLDDLWPGIAKT